MSPERAERKLAAILAVDVVGYSRLMRADEDGTLARLKELRRDLFDPKIAEYRGRVVKTTGDGILIEFPSAVDAVQHAVDVQRELKRRNAIVPADRRMEIRMGINVGDVIVEGDDLFGDGVNVAARLEGEAEPGGICISESAHEQVHRKLDLTFNDLGARALKNIDEPVRVFGVQSEPGQRVTAAAPPTSQTRGVLVAALLVLAILIGAGVFFWTDRGNETPARISADATDSVAAEAATTTRPSIAVLPFENMSNDPEQEYFADGMTEDIITDLSKLSALSVVASNASFQYKGKTVDVKRVGRELGVNYVLEGSVRRAGDQVRINAQLIDVETGGHLWAERYDGGLADVFALQDKVTGQIIAALSLQLGAGEIAELTNHGTINFEAYDAFLKGQSYASKYTADDAKRAIASYIRALELDPNYQRAKEALEQIRHIEKFSGFK